MFTNKVNKQKFVQKFEIRIGCSYEVNEIVHCKDVEKKLYFCIKRMVDD